MSALSRAARYGNPMKIAMPKCPIVVYKTYPAIDYINVHLSGIWALTKNGTLCFNFWPDYLIGRDRATHYQNTATLKTIGRGDTIIADDQFAHF